MDKVNKANLMGAFSRGCFQKFIAVILVAMLTFVSCTISPGYALADDYFDCFDGKKCDKALSTSEACKQPDDYKITHPKTPSPATSVTVLSFHGGKIEDDTSDISKSLQKKYGWDRYDLNGHVTTKACNSLIKESSDKNFDILHITATNFDDPDALALIDAHPKSVAIHGYGASRIKSNSNYSKGTICVGGANTIEINAFIDYVNNNKSKFQSSPQGYSLIPVNAPLVPEDLCTKKPRNEKPACCGLEGTSKKNIVNKNSSKKGGLQLELSPGIRDDLINDNTDFNSLRSVIYGAINQAMSVDTLND